MCATRRIGKRLSALSLAVALVLHAGLGAAQEGGAIPSCALSVVRGHVIIPVSINDSEPVPFVLDSGSSDTVVDSATVRSLRLHQDNTGPAPAPPMGPRVHTDSFQWADTTFPVGLLQSADLLPLREKLGHDVFGVAGLSGPLLMKQVIVLDFPNLRAEVREAGEVAPAGSLEMRFTREGAPTVPISVEVLLSEPSLPPVVFDARLDTTVEAALVFPRDAAASAGLLKDGIPRIEIESPDGVGPVYGRTQIRLGRLKVGDAVLEEPVCSIADTGPVVLGTGFLRRFLVTLDFATGRLTFQRPNEDTLRDGSIEGYGLSPCNRARGYWSVYVATPSPAQEAGIVTGDRLLALNGKDLEDVSYDALCRCLAAPQGTMALFTYLHGLEERAVSLQARRLL